MDQSKNVTLLKLKQMSTENMQAVLTRNINYAFKLDEKIDLLKKEISNSTIKRTSDKTEELISKIKNTNTIS